MDAPQCATALYTDGRHLPGGGASVVARRPSPVSRSQLSSASDQRASPVEDSSAIECARCVAGGGGLRRSSDLPAGRGMGQPAGHVAGNHLCVGRDACLPAMATRRTAAAGGFALDASRLARLALSGRVDLFHRRRAVSSDGRRDATGDVARPAMARARNAGEYSMAPAILRDRGGGRRP